MKKGLAVTAGTMALLAMASAGFADVPKGGQIDPKHEFEEHCAVCHPNGGNTMNPAKTLSKKDRDANGLKTWKDIVKYMRNPGPGMTKFDKKAIADKEAKAIAEYIVKTFK